MVFPGWFNSNPYLNMLYLVPRTRGYEITSGSNLQDLLALIAETRRRDVIHLHWTGPITQYAPTVEDARRRLKEFTRAVTSAQRRGVRLLWTIHNRLPHECPYPEVEKALMNFLAANADLVVAINPHTRDFLSDLVTLDETRLVHLPHPAYRGLYPDDITREEARSRLGVDDDQEAVLFFGQMRAYKGLKKYFTAMTRLHQTGRNVVMLMAGKTTAADLEWIDEAMPPDLPAVRDHRFIPDEEIQIWFRAADAVVLPFENVLNSGSVFLCASFERSVVLSRQPQLEAEIGNQSWVHYYDPSDEHALGETISTALGQPDAEAAARTFAAERTPYRFSLAFDGLLQELEPKSR